MFGDLGGAQWWRPPEQMARFNPHILQMFQSEGCGLSAMDWGNVWSSTLGSWMFYVLLVALIFSLYILQLWYPQKPPTARIPFCEHQKPELTYAVTSQNQMFASLRCLVQPYVPSPWLLGKLGGHVQSAMFALWCPPKQWRPLHNIHTRKEVFESTFDGGQLSVVWLDLVAPQQLPDDSPIVLMLPGVVGKGSNVYCRRMALHFAERLGWRTVVKNWRGIGSEVTSCRPETWDDVALQDTMDTVRFLRAQYPNVPMFGVGYSFGGSLLTTLVGTHPASEHTLRAVVNISGIFDFGPMMGHIATEWGWFYDYLNTKVTLTNYKKFRVVETLTSPADTPAVSRTGSVCSVDSYSSGEDSGSEPASPVPGAVSSPLGSPSLSSPPLSSPPLRPGSSKSLDLSEERIAAIKGHRSFHETFTIPYTGDATVDDYIARVEEMTLQALTRVNVPVLALLAKDDPLCPPLAWKKALQACALNENIIVCMTEAGGHCGFWQGISGHSWVDIVAEEYLEAAFSATDVHVPTAEASPSAPGSPMVFRGSDAGSIGPAVEEHLDCCRGVKHVGCQELVQVPVC